ncbi:MAG: uroporphyrinogen-III synthase [Bacteroides sp.]|nr:uroporphyrinogen-III synthase [Bacteroides sp.]MCM1456344.1 uroporphyrinogen-III synthase [Lachnoclostridium sp.]
MKIKKILVSQPKPTSEKSPYYDIAYKHDVEIVFRPFFKVEGLSAKEFRQQKINISDFTAIIFTSKTAIDHFFRLCEEMRINIPDTMKYFCTAEPIALYLQKYIVYRKRKIFHGATGKLDGLVPSLVKHKDEKYLYCVNDGHPMNEPVLDEAGVNYTTAVMSRSVSNDFAPDEAFDYDMIVFFSPHGIAALKKNFPEFEQGDKVIAALGTAAQNAVRDAGFRLDIEAPTPKTPSMPSAIDRYLNNLDDEE